MAISSQELSELKSRVLAAMRTGANIARVSDYIISLIREAGSSLPERAKSDTDVEYLYSIIIAVEGKRSSKAEPPKTTHKEDPPPVEAAPDITTEEVEPDTDSQWPEPAEQSAPEQTESAPKNKGSKQPKKGRK